MVLVYHHLMPYDIADRTWFTLDWDKVHNTEDLLAIRTQQIARKQEHIGKAMKHQAATRQRAADDKTWSLQHRVRTEPLQPGMWVLQHETWLDNQHGNKGSLHWAGPYVVHQQHPSGSYSLRELDGTLLKEKAAGSRLKLFYFRDSYQTMSAGWVRDTATQDSLSSCPQQPASFCGTATTFQTLSCIMCDSPDAMPIIDEATGEATMHCLDPELPEVWDLSNVHTPVW